MREPVTPAWDGRTGTAGGAAFGAARLARLAATSEEPSYVCRPPERVETVRPDERLVGAYAERTHRYRALYRALKV